MIEAAEVIHTDFAQRFVKAEVIDWQQLVKLGSWVEARKKGKVQLVGKQFTVQNGQVLEILISN